jgi:hypothetical protein
MSRPDTDRPEGAGAELPPAPGSTDPTPRTHPLVPAPGPEIRPLTRRECEAVLRRNMVGRIAYAFERRVEILPIHYVYEDGWLYGRTSPGAKISMWRHSQWVAFEVDEVRALFDWTSVVAHGGLYVVHPDATEAEAEVWERAVVLLRRVVPDTGSVHDPVPHRTIVFRIHVDELDGRTAQPPAPA